MKVVICLLVVLLPFSGIFAQVSGNFYYGSYQGQVCVFFKGINESGKDLHKLKVYCQNDVLLQQMEFDLQVMKAKDTFTVGPVNGWKWQTGEKLCIKYLDGKTTCWVCNLTSLNHSYYSDFSGYDNRVDIEQLRYKIRDAERSLREYERMNARNPSVTGMMLVMEQMKLIQTYRERLYTLIQRLHD